MFNRAILFGKNSTVLMAVWAVKKKLEKAFSRFSDYHSDIGAYLNFAKYSNISRHIFKIVKLRKERDGSEVS